MYWITILIFLSLDETCDSKSILRIKNGRNARDGEFPFVVSFFYAIGMPDRQTSPKIKVYRFCTGSLIAEAWVLTAAHCVIDQEPQSFYVWHTNFTTSPLETQLFTNVHKVFVHPSYVEDDYLLDNDISLLLVDKFASSSVGRLLAVDHLTLVGLPVTYVGGGMTTKPDDDNIRSLQVGAAAIVPCSNRHGSTKYIICVAPKCERRHQKPWFGDSGGPLLYEGRIIGVTSFGSVDPLDGEAFAAVSPHLDWIASVVRSQFDQNPTGLKTT